MERFYNAGGTDTSSGSATSGIWTALIKVAIEFGVSYLSMKKENKANMELLEAMLALDQKQAAELKQRLNVTLTEIAKTQVIIEFLEEQKIKKLEQERKKHLISYIGLGVGVIVLFVMYFKLKNKNG